MPEKKGYISMSKGVHKQKLCTLQELYNAFKEKHPKVNIGFSKFQALGPKWCVLAGSEITHSVCVCSADQCCVATRRNGLGSDIQRPAKLTLSCFKYFH